MSLVGKSLGKYQILAEIGRGGMGTVYRGYDAALDRPVALKVMAPHLAGDDRLVQRFLREARTVARLNHPHIVSIHDVGQQDGIYYLVMAYIEGEPLRKLIAREGRLAPGSAATVLEQVAAALDYAHSQGIVHRDVKPANILLDGAGRAILTDFGIAYAAGLTGLTATGASLGTPEYMSPEQAAGGTPDARSDVYALGIVLYEMLTGRVPFRAETPLAVLRMQADEAPPPPRRWVPSLSPALEGVVLRALAKDPARRYSRAGQLAAEARGTVVAPGGMVPAPASQDSAGPAASRARSQRALWTWVLLAFMAVALGAGGLWLVLGAGPGSGTPLAPAVTVPSLATATATAGPPRPTQQQTKPAPLDIHIEYILSGSNMMMQPLAAGQTGLDAARGALARHWQDLPAPLNAGLRLYGHRLSAADGNSCTDTELVVPIAPGTANGMIAAAEGAAARGMAPLTRSLVEASGDFDYVPERTNALILLAGGGDSCGGQRPCQTVKSHHEVGLDYAVYVVGLRVDAQAKQELTCLVRSSGGQYRDASNQAEVLDALNSFVRDIVAGAP